MAGIADVARVQIAFASDPWAASPTWTDVTAVSDAERKLRGTVSVELDKGRVGGAGGTFVPAVLTVVANNDDADWDQSNSGSTFGVANLKRNKPIRFLVSDDNFTGSQPLFTGYIDDIVPSGEQFSSTATITASDMSRLLAEYDVIGLVRPEEFSGERVQAILDEVGVPAGFISVVQNGTVRMPASTLNSDAWSLLQDCVKAEMGIMFIDRHGDFVFRERYAPLAVTAWSVRQHSFTADGNGATSQVLSMPMRRTLGSIHNVTRVTASRVDGTTNFEYDTTAANNPPVTPAEGPHSLQLAYDSDVQVAAQAWHKQWDFDGQRLSEFMVMAYPDHDNAITALEAGYYDPLTRVEVQTQPKGFASDWNFEARIEGYRHSITHDEWLVTMTVSPYQTQWTDDGENLWYEFGATMSAQDLGGL